MKNNPNWEFEDVNGCLFCGSKRSEVILDRLVRSIPLKFVRCQSCGLIYQSPRLTNQALADYFSSKEFIRDTECNEGKLRDSLGYNDYFAWDESYRKTARLRLDKVDKYIRPPAMLLEIGTATGAFLNEAKKAGFTVSGLDISSTFAQIAREKYDLDIDIGFIEDHPLPEEHFDLICNFGGIACWRDPLRGLQNIKKALKPGGFFVFNYFNCDSLLPRLLGTRHFEYNIASLIIFSDTLIKKFLEKVGLKIVYLEYEKQFANLERIATYFLVDSLKRALETLKLHDLTIPVTAYGTRFAICISTK